MSTNTAKDRAEEIVPVCGCGRPAIRHDDGLYSVCLQCGTRATPPLPPAAATLAELGRRMQRGMARRADQGEKP